MPHELDDEFFTKLFRILLDYDPLHADVSHHVGRIRWLLSRYPNDRYAKILSSLNNTELEAMVRFVEKPHGRHHLLELEKMLKKVEPYEVGKLFLHHFYEHAAKKMPHTEKLKHVK